MGLWDVGMGERVPCNMERNKRDHSAWAVVEVQWGLVQCDVGRVIMQRGMWAEVEGTLCRAGCGWRGSRSRT